MANRVEFADDIEMDDNNTPGRGNRKGGGDEEKKPKEWHSQQESILKKWSEIGSSYRYMHDRAYAKYNKQNFRFALPVIIISTVTGTANFAQGTFPTSWQSYVPLGIGFLNLSAGLLTTVAQFLRVSELLEGHRAASIAYSKFSRNISVELSLPREERTTGGTEYVNVCRTELDRLIEQSPNIPIEIIKEFGDRFNDTDFMKPEILNITSVKVYHDDKKQKAKERLEQIKQAEKIRNRLLREETMRRKSILSELMQEQRLQEEKMKVEAARYKKAKKEQVSVSSVEQKMSKLLSKLQNADQNNDIITPSSSETGDEDDTPMSRSSAGGEIGFVVEDMLESGMGGLGTDVNENMKKDLDNAAALVKGAEQLRKSIDESAAAISGISGTADAAVDTEEDGVINDDETVVTINTDEPLTPDILMNAGVDDPSGN